MKSFLNFANKNILLTGASRGIGLATAQQLLQAGAQVYCLSRSRGGLEALMAQYPNQVTHLAADLAHPQDIPNYLQALPEKLHGVICNAGYFHPSLLRNCELNDFNHHLQVNVTSAFVIIRECWSRLAAARGSVVLVSSLAGVPYVEKFATAGAYTASKMALSGLCEVLAVEGRESGIRANVIAPGSVDTEMLRTAYPEMKADFHPDDIARQILFWVSEASAPVSGSIVQVRV